MRAQYEDTVGARSDSASTDTNGRAERSLLADDLVVVDGKLSHGSPTLPRDFADELVVGRDYLDHERPADTDRKLGALTRHDARHTFAYRLSAASGHNRAELQRRLGHSNDRYLRLYTNPPGDIAANWAEDL